MSQGYVRTQVCLHFVKKVDLEKHLLELYFVYYRRPKTDVLLFSSVVLPAHLIVTSSLHLSFHKWDETKILAEDGQTFRMVICSPSTLPECEGWVQTEAQCHHFLCVCVGTGEMCLRDKSSSFNISSIEKSDSISVWRSFYWQFTFFKTLPDCKLLTAAAASSLHLTHLISSHGSYYQPVVKGSTLLYKWPKEEHSMIETRNLTKSTKISCICNFYRFIKLS